MDFINASIDAYQQLFSTITIVNISFIIAAFVSVGLITPENTKTLKRWMIVPLRFGLALLVYPVAYLTVAYLRDQVASGIWITIGIIVLCIVGFYLMVKGVK